jgi:menaquinone-dependent protoporphyrinogen oxidase
VSARVLVAYASKLGSTGEIAETIAQVLRDAGHRALAVPARDVRSLDEWDAVILGSAVYAAYWQKDARAFADRFRDGLKARPLWLFSGGPLDRRLARADQPITPHGAEITADLGARAHRTFGGRLSPKADVPAQVLQTHRLGDFRDWQAIVEYAHRIGRELDRMRFPPSAGPAARGG